MTAAGTCALVTAASLVAGNAPAARERIGVLILPADGTDAALADNLTEVAIAKLAETPAHELVGARQIRRRQALSGAEPIGLPCLDQPACLARLGAVIGARRLVV